MTEKVLYHIGRSGVGICKATVRLCPYGDESNHYTTLEEAQAVFEKANTPRLFASLKKDPHTAHIGRAQKRIKQLEKEFSANELRQGKETIYARMSLPTPEVDMLLRRDYYPRTAGVGIAQGNGRTTYSHMQGPADGDPLVGLLYVPDHASEEERGVPELAKLLREGVIAKNAVVYEETSDGMGVFRITMLNDAETTFRERPYDSLVDLYTHFDDSRIDQLNKDVWGMTSKEIAGLAAERGLVLPKNDFQARTIVAEQLRQETIPHARGDFSSGRTLTIVSDDPTHKAFMKAALEAHESGNLRLGNSLRSGVVFYDARDVTRKTREDAIYKEEANKAAKEYIEPLKKELSHYGAVFSMSPNATEDTRDIRDVRYSVNFSSKDRRKPQLFGRFTRKGIEELIAEQKFDSGVDELLDS